MEFQHELIIPNEGFPFKLFLFEGRNGNYVREKHWHTSIEIFAVMEGSLYFYIDENEYPLKAGEFLIINSNEVHSIQAPVRNETIVLQIPLKQFSDYFTAQRFIRFRSRNEESEETDRRMVSLIREMYRVYVSGETGYEFRIRAVFYEVLYLMVSAYRETEVEENALNGGGSCFIRDYLGYQNGYPILSWQMNLEDFKTEAVSALQNYKIQLERQPGF